MKKLLLILLLTLGFLTLYQNENQREPSSRPNFDRAIKETGKAILKTNTVRSYKRTLEKKAFSKISTYSGLNKDTIKKSLPVIKTLATGKISTEGVRINWRPTENMNIQPTIEYDLRTEEFNTSFQLQMEF